MKSAGLSVVLLFVAGLLTACGGGRDLSPEQQAVQALLTPPNLLGDRDRSRAEPSDSAGSAGPVDVSQGLSLGVPPDAGWAIVGRAMIRSGFAIVESDADAATHLIRYAGSEDGVERFILRVTDRPIGERGVGSRVVVENEDGSAPPEPVARQILGVLAEQLRP